MPTRYIHTLLIAALVSMAVTLFQHVEASSRMTAPPRLSAEDLRNKTLEQMTALYGTPDTVEFTLGGNVNEFRIPLLNRFDAAEIESDRIVLLEATFSLDADNNLTVWFRGPDYVDHLVYDKLTDF